MKVSLAEVVLGEKERIAILAAFDARQISSYGAYVEKFEERCRAVTARAHAVSCTNGTVALELALRASGVGVGDEVICPTFTFSGTAAAIIHVGAVPVLVDADPDTWCLSPDAVKRAVTRQTKAVISVDVFGVPCDYLVLEKWCQDTNLFLIEDAAEAVGATQAGRVCGSFGTISTLSFYENKIITAGEGGVCVTDDASLAARITQLKNHGARAGAHGVFDIAGYNYRMTNIPAAIACAQFEQHADFAARRGATDAQYRAALGGCAGVTFQAIPPNSQSSHWMTGILFEGNVTALVAALAADDIETRRFFLPIHAQPYAATWPSRNEFPVAERLYARGLCLPNGNTTTPEQVAYVCERLMAHIATLAVS